MSALMDELRQHALMHANKMQRAEAYSRVKTLPDEACPVCWVEKEDESRLEIEAYATNVNLYRCKKCDFRCVLPKPD